MEKGVFNWPAKNNGKNTITITEQQLSWILDGLSMDEQGAHKEVLNRKMI